MRRFEVLLHIFPIHQIVPFPLTSIFLFGQGHIKLEIQFLEISRNWILISSQFFYSSCVHLGLAQNLFVNGYGQIESDPEIYYAMN